MSEFEEDRGDCKSVGEHGVGFNWWGDILVRLETYKSYVVEC